MDLQKKLDKQVKIAAWQLGLGVGVFILIIIMVAVGVGSLGHNGSSYDDEPSSSFPIGVIICGFGLFAVGIAKFVLWIMGIVNACNINTITNNSSILIIFSIFTFFIAHIIVAVSQRKQFASGSFTSNNQNMNSSNFGNNSQNNNNYNNENDFEAKLKKQFIDGEISSEEYEKILKQFKNK